MKVCILGDTHFGVRSDSKTFIDYYRKFYDDFFFPYLVSNKITEIYQLGDLFDRRKFINFLTLAEARDYFFDKAKKHGIHIHVLIGNHDIFWKESLQINSPDLLLKDYDNITLYTKPTTVKIEGVPVDIIPWICKDNEEEIHQFIKESKSKMCFGHFEISGFQMYKGIDNHDGISPKTFKKYDMVLSGHYHHRSSAGNIVYVGTPMEHTWMDCEDDKGFHLLSTGTKELEFIKNPYTIFKKIYYDDTKKVESIPDCSNQYLKLIVVNKTDFVKFERFIESLYKMNPLELKIVEDYSEYETQGTLLDDEVNLQDTYTLLNHHVDDLDTQADKTRIKTLMKTLYVEAQNFIQN